MKDVRESLLKTIQGTVMFAAGVAVNDWLQETVCERFPKRSGARAAVVVILATLIYMLLP